MDVPVSGTGQGWVDSGNTRSSVKVRQWRKEKPSIGSKRKKMERERELLLISLFHLASSCALSSWRFLSPSGLHMNLSGSSLLSIQPPICIDRTLRAQLSPSWPQPSLNACDRLSHASLLQLETFPLLLITFSLLHMLLFKTLQLPRPNKICVICKTSHSNTTPPQ